MISVTPEFYLSVDYESTSVHTIEEKEEEDEMQHLAEGNVVIGYDGLPSRKCLLLLYYKN